MGSIVPYGEGITGMAVLTHDVQSASSAAGAAFHRVAGDGAPSAVLTAPLLSGDRLLGVLTAVSFDRRKVFSPDDARLYGMFANVAAIVVGQQRRMELLAAEGKTSSSAAIPGPERNERALVDAVLALARSRSGRAAALLQLLADLERLP